MKKAVFICMIALKSIFANGQENSGKFKLHALNAGFGLYGADTRNDDGGVSFVADATFSINKNLISVSYLTGAEISLFDEKFEFKEPALMYGRDWKPKKWFALEGFAGIGNYSVRYRNGDTGFEDVTDNAISFPLRLNTKFYFNEHFGMGVNTNYSINSLANTLSTNILFHYRFN